MTTLHSVQMHYTRPQRYVAPATLVDAAALLADPANQPARIIAGGSDLLLEIQRGARVGLETLIDISRVIGSSQIVISDGVAHLGPMVTHNMVAGHAELIGRALPLAQACWEIGSPQLRNRATIAGNLVTASPANDTISPLLALDAGVELLSVRGLRTLRLEHFITGFRTTSLAVDEIVTGIQIPLLQPNQRGIFVKLGNRRAQAISVVHLAIVVSFEPDGATVQAANIALGSVAATVVLAPSASAALVGQRLTAEVIDLAARLAGDSVVPIADIRATAEYRQQTISVMVRRALSALAAGTQAAHWPVDAPMLVTRSSSVSMPVVNTHCGPETAITATVNGVARSAAGGAGATLLEWLREELGATGTKEGCAEGECGACTVQLDGNAVMSCLVPAARAEGSTIVTVEGLGINGALHPVQQAFVACGAVQCGFCTPGFIVAGATLLEECPQPTTEQIGHGLAGNLCRCTGYKSIIEAIHQAAQVAQ